MLDLNKTISINQTASSIVKIKPTGAFPIFNIQPGNTLNLNYVDMFLNPNSQNTMGRAIFNSGNLQLSNVSIRERALNITGSGSTIQNNSSGQINVLTSSQITIQN